MSNRLALCGTLALLVVGLGTGLHAQQRPADPATFAPPLSMPEVVARFLPLREPGADDFAAEADAEAIEARLADFGANLRRDPRTPLAPVLAPDFRGAAPRFDVATTHAQPEPLAVVRAAATDGAATLDARAFARHVAAGLAPLRTVTVAEFEVTAIESVSSAPPASEVPARLAHAEVRYDIVGVEENGARVGHVGRWQMTWRPGPAGWQVVSWTTTAHVTSRAPRALFTDVSHTAFGSAPSFRRQLSVDLDSWMATIDGVLTRDSNGHHGVSVGDADGDGRDDLYVAQPAGLPNLLYRARGDGTYEDITARAGVGLLDDTAHSLFADVDNDGDQDLVLATSLQPLLLENDGTGRFTLVSNAFVFARPLQGVLTGLAMADADRDGLLDVYLCVYSYFFGAGEEKAGTPMPYYDARNGPPGVLFRNDGRGRFVDVTAAAGLDHGNDRYHFAATWADYDDDGWPDLLVANDFGTKNLYRNLGASTPGRGMRFEDVAAAAGVLDHGAGMSAAVLDYDNDGRLDIYTGNMWSAAGQRITAQPGFMPEAPAEVRALYRRHARGNSLLRNRGDGGFDDRTVEAGAAFGRWAWAADALDFDSDGWQDLYVTNGMLTRRRQQGDLESFFWRQVVARSPLTRAKGTTYDDAWRAINQWLVHDGIASDQRNVLLRNDGHGGFDDVSGTVGLDLRQDGRSFAVLDADHDGDPDLAVMAARQAPQLRLLRNDHPSRAAISIRLQGRVSNRDAVGARVRVTAGRLQAMRVVTAGSGFLSQHSRELLVGLGASTSVQTLTVEWPSGERQTFTDLPVGMRYRLVEGGALEREPFARPSPAAPAAAVVAPADPPEATWLYEPFPVPEFSEVDFEGNAVTLASLRGTPTALLLWRADVPAARAALADLAAATPALQAAGVSVLAVALDPTDAGAAVRTAAPPTLPIVHARREFGLLWAIVHRHLFMNRQPVGLPTLLLLDPEGRVARVYRGSASAEQVLADASQLDAEAPARLARALPFAGAFHAALPTRNFLPFGRELLDEGLDGAAITAFERAAAANPDAPTLYRLGTLVASSGDAARARAAFERALALDPALAEAHNDLGALEAQQGDVERAIVRFREALAAMPDYPDALNNLGYALLLSGRDAEARTLYERALALQPDFPEALNNLGLLAGRAGDLTTAERHFRAALSRRPAYGDAANNLALVLVARGDADDAVALLEALLQTTPTFEPGYVTLAKIHLAGGRTPEGLRALERLLQRNPTHPLALALQREYRPR